MAIVPDLSGNTVTDQPSIGRFASRSIGAQDTFVATLPLAAGQGYDISVTGTFTATVSIQRRLEGDDAWGTVQTVSGSGSAISTQLSGIAEAKQELRVGVLTGDYTSGTALCSVRTGRVK